MRNQLALFGLLFFYQSLAWSDLSLRVIDQQGDPLVNVVVAIAADNLQARNSAMLPDKSAIKDTLAVMDQVDKQFSPHVLIVEKGQQVVFPNSDQVRHHVYSFSKPNEFEIKLYSGDQADPVRFEYPGIVVLGCNIHDQMVGYIYVAENELAKVTDDQGYVHFEGLSVAAPEDLDVTLWHSRLSNSKVERVKQTLGEQQPNGDWQLVLDLLPEVTKETRKFKPRFQ